MLLLRSLLLKPGFCMPWVLEDGGNTGPLKEVCGAHGHAGGLKQAFVAEAGPGYCLFSFVLFFAFRDRASPCSFCRPGTCFVDQTSLDLREPLQPLPPKF